MGDGKWGKWKGEKNVEELASERGRRWKERRWREEVRGGRSVEEEDVRRKSENGSERGE